MASLNDLKLLNSQLDDILNETRKVNPDELMNRLSQAETESKKNNSFIGNAAGRFGTGLYNLEPGLYRALGALMNGYVGEGRGNSFIKMAQEREKDNAELSSYFQGNRKYDEDPIGSLGTLEYWTDPRGAWGDIWEGVGSSAPFLAMSAIPGGGAVGGALGLASKSSKLMNIPGVKKVANLFGKGLDVPKGTAIAKTPWNYADEMLTRGAGMAGLDAFINSGEVQKNLAQKGGYSDEEIANRVMGNFFNELPFDVAANTLLGGFVTGRLQRLLGGGEGASLARQIGTGIGLLPIEAGSEGLQEVMQDNSVRRYSDEAYNDWYNPYTWDAQDKRAFVAGSVGSLLPGVGGVVSPALTYERPGINPNLSSEEIDAIVDSFNNGNNAPIQNGNANSAPQRREPANTPALSANAFDTNLISKWESAPGATDLDNVRPEVKGAFNSLVGELGQSGKITITGGAEKGYHAGGEFGHEGGWKLDVDPASIEDKDKFLALCEKYGITVGDEGDYYDFSFHKNASVGGRRIVNPSTSFSDMGANNEGTQRRGGMTKEEFFAAVAGQESGGNYNAQNGRTGAWGKYQIMPENWSPWAKQAGLSADADRRDPQNQEIVARHKLGEYFDKYGPEGALVAWYAGEANAERWVNGEKDAIGEGGHYSWDAKQGNGNEPSIREYVEQALGRIGQTPSSNANVSETNITQDNSQDNVEALKRELQNIETSGLSREQRQALLQMVTEQQARENDPGYADYFGNLVKSEDYARIIELFPQESAEILGLRNAPTIGEMREAITDYYSNALDNNSLSMEEMGSINKTLQSGNGQRYGSCTIALG